MGSGWRLGRQRPPSRACLVGLGRSPVIHSPGERRVMGGAVSALVLRGEPLCGWLPGAAEHELVQDFHGTASVLAGGVDVAADVEAVLRAVVAGEAAGDVLLDFQGADAAL